MDVDVEYADEEYVDEGKGVCVCLREEEEGE